MQRVDQTTMNLEMLPAAGTDRAAAICDLDDALRKLAEKDPRRAEVIELRFFGVLSVEETADALRASPQTVMGDWRARG
jgi:DNA-directed RNA polymerase specialized sigma24 family protein